MAAEVFSLNLAASGAAIEVEEPDLVTTLERGGWGAHVTQTEGTGNSFHLPLPSLHRQGRLIVAGLRTKLRGSVKIDRVRLWQGGYIDDYADPPGAGANLMFSQSLDFRGYPGGWAFWVRDFYLYEEGPFYLSYGLTMSIHATWDKLAEGWEPGQLVVFGAFAGFDRAERPY